MGRLRWHRDLEDNCLVRATFDGVSDQLQIDSRLVILQYDHEPLDLFVDDYAVDYPFSYAPSDWSVLDAYRLSVPVDQILPWPVDQRSWRPGAAIQSYALLKRLNLAIHQLISYRKREEPGVQTPPKPLPWSRGPVRHGLSFHGSGPASGFRGPFRQRLQLHLAASGGHRQHPCLGGSVPPGGWLEGIRSHLRGHRRRYPHRRRRGPTPESVPPIAGSFSGASLLSMEWASG